MKLKNWKKIAEDETSILWELISDPSQEVMVTKEPEGRSWYIDTPFGELSVAKSKEKAKQKAISWMEKHPQIREKDIAKKFITDIVVDENLSLLVNGPLSFLKEVLKTTQFEMSCEGLKEALEEVLEETQSNEVRQLLKELSEKKEDLDVYRREQQQMKKRMCDRRRVISKKRNEVQRAELVTNEDLEGKTIMIESSKYTNGVSMVLCHFKGDLKRKLRFKPNWFQKQKLLSWELAPEEWPLEVDVVRSPKKKFFIFIKPVKLNAFFFNGKYLFREFPSVKQKKSFRSAREILHQKLQKYYNKEMRWYEVKTEEAFKKVQEIIDANVFYDLEVIKDPEEFVVVAPIDQECIYEYEDRLGEHRRINLKEICLGYQLKDDQQLFLMATKSGVNYAVKEFGAKKLNS